MRAPSQCLVVDANIVLGVAFGLRARTAFERVASQRALVTSERTQAESLGRASDLRDGSPEALGFAQAVLGLVTVFDAGTTEPLPAGAARRLQHATPARNGSTRDAHRLALARITQSDIWSHDRDFAGTGWPSWSSGNLLAALGG